MTVEQHDVVDFAGVDREGRAVLTIADHLSWADPSDHLWQLQEKLNAYLRFLESGEIHEKYPQAADRSVLIDIVLKYPIPANCEEFFTQCRAAIEKAGFQLSTRLGPQP